MKDIYDTKALELSRQVMAIMYGPMPAGGSVQLQAKIQNLFIEAMQFADPKVSDGWIPVSERLPDFFYDVLVADEYDDMTIATPVDLSIGDRCAFRMSNGDIFLATHWQPLPDAPKWV